MTRKYARNILIFAVARRNINKPKVLNSIFGPLSWGQIVEYRKEPRVLAVEPRVPISQFTVHYRSPEQPSNTLNAGWFFSQQALFSQGSITIHQDQSDLPGHTSSGFEQPFSDPQTNFVGVGAAHTHSTPSFFNMHL